MGELQEKCPNHIFTLFISKYSVFIHLNAVCGYILFFPLRYIQIEIVIMKLKAEHRRYSCIKGVFVPSVT